MRNDLINQQVIVRNYRIAAGTHGSGEPMVLLHGTPSSSHIWRNVTPLLIKAGFKIHVFDLLGFGLSERPQAGNVDTSMSGQVPILEEMLEYWGLESFHLVAHDIGGGIAQRFGISSPDRLKTLTMIDVVSFDSYPSRRTKQQMQNGLEALMKAPEATHRAHFRDWLLSAVYEKHRFEEGPLETYLDYISGPIGQPSLFEHQVKHYDPVHTLEVADRLGELENLPVQLIWGANDEWQVPEWGQKLHDAIPGSILTILENCGHFSPEDQPEKIAELVSQFVQSTSGR
ncbi:alpha/beta hydrolase [Rhizobium sp. SSA_523]|uniref:alpha/beta fold hydrolase n=1 Tax=Rhizobium sp. SSA_523 TaxID=2952477 RepID=UPI00209056D8|nr:alpha/beta hydrolase [Rhizobium sp. SSA_523]MCO5734400.1 alpha/beta hydrolase [Rhizobium sp. SSA_523]WKC21148.1 alpha/beta hydrolase [Rhizobium sp. SSA_523]